MLTAAMYHHDASQALFSFIGLHCVSVRNLVAVESYLKIIYIPLDVLLVIQYSVLKLSLRQRESFLKQNNYCNFNNAAFITHANYVA